MRTSLFVAAFDALMITEWGSSLKLCGLETAAILTVITEDKVPPSNEPLHVFVFFNPTMEGKCSAVIFNYGTRISLKTWGSLLDLLIPVTI